MYNLYLTDTAAILNSVRFEEYYGMSKGHEPYPKYSHQYLRALFGPIFLSVFVDKDCNRKEIVLPCLDVIAIALCRGINIEVLFLLEKRA